MPEKLLAHIKRYVSLDGDDEALLRSHLKVVRLEKKDFLLKEGQVCRSNHFILEGLCRLYFVTEEGNEQIIQFAIENWWITDYISLDSQQPSQYYVQALEPTSVAVLEKKVQDELFQKLPQLERYFRLILQRAYAASVMRVHWIFTQSGEERYHHFNTSFPEFVQRVPQYMLASYLGFTPEFLSKIRSKRQQ